MGIDRTRQAIDTLVRNRGETAKKIWQIMGGFEPANSPEVVVQHLERSIGVLRTELVKEAKQLAKDIRAVIENPPIPR